jgi:hypothetical protein
MALKQMMTIIKGKMENGGAWKKVTVSTIRWRGSIQKLCRRIEDAAREPPMEVEVEDVGKWREGAKHPRSDGRGQCTVDNGKLELISIQENKVQGGIR